MTGLELRSVSKSYTKGTAVLREISLSVRKGELFFLLGPSGCGKSTLLRIIAGLVEQDSGEIILDGRDIGALPPERRNTPMVFQNYALWPHMDVFENVAFGLRTRKIPAPEIRRRVNEILERVQMMDYAKRKIASLSGGQQQRVALARALVLDPAVLLLDEPLSNLDAKLRDHMRGEIRALCRERNLTAVYVTHDRREALGMADRAAVLKDGILQQTGAPRELYLHPANPFTASFLGDADFLEGETLSAADGNVLFRTSAGDLLAEHGAFTPEPGEKCLLMFRPESVRFPGNGGSDVNKIRVRAGESFYFGEITQRNLHAGNFSFLADEQDAPDRSEGSEFEVRIPPDRLRYFRKEV